MIKINMEKIMQLPTVNAMLDAKYGKKGTPTRKIFDRESDAYYHQVIAEAEARNRKQVVMENVPVSEENFSTNLHQPV